MISSNNDEDVFCGGNSIKLIYGYNSMNTMVLSGFFCGLDYFNFVVYVPKIKRHRYISRAYHKVLIIRPSKLMLSEKLEKYDTYPTYPVY